MRAVPPGDAVAQFNRGNEFARRGQFAEAAACYQRALALEPKFARAHLDLGRVLVRLGRPTEAADSCRRAIALAPDWAEAHNTLGSAQLRSAQHEPAIASFRQALRLEANFAEAHANLGNALRTIGRLDEAVSAYQAAVQLEPGFIAAHTELATALRLLGRTAECEACCLRVLAQDPNSVATLEVLAELRADSGRHAEAEELFKRAIAINPGAARSWAGLARLRRMTRADASWEQAVLQLIGRGLPTRDEMLLRYSLGKYFDDIRDFDTAFGHYRRANELAKQCGPRHDRAALTRGIDLIIASHDRAWIDRHHAWINRHRGRPAGHGVEAADSQRPVLIVGMPRSGTTLVEQILASHPAVHGAGELNFWSAELAAAISGTPDTSGTSGTSGNPGTSAGPGHISLLRPTDAALAELGARYDGLLQQLSAGAARVVDKYPTNFLSLGLIHAALPGARIIHMRRNPLDTCLSIYFQHFESANTYANDLEDLAHYYAEYRRLMRHWREVVAASTVLEVSYEGLVEDLEGWTRRMLDWLGLPWDARCLEFHRTSRSVVTASKQQVRQAVHAFSLGRWRHYEKFIAPLLSLAPDAIR